MEQVTVLCSNWRIRHASEPHFMAFHGLLELNALESHKRSITQDGTRLGGIYQFKIVQSCHKEVAQETHTEMYTKSPFLLNSNVPSKLRCDLKLPCSYFITYHVETSISTHHGLALPQTTT